MYTASVCLSCDCPVAHDSSRGTEAASARPLESMSLAVSLTITFVFLQHRVVDN